MTPHPKSRQSAARMSKERPILFSGPMVRAIIEGRKTQTRRIIKPQPPFDCEYVINGAHRHALCRSISEPHSWAPPTANSKDHKLPSPFGHAGEQLWVREAWRTSYMKDEMRPIEMVDNCLIRYEADNGFNRVNIDPETEFGRYRHGRFMCRWMSRITLGITDVRVERLQDISEEDAKAEGCDFPAEGPTSCYRMAYRHLFEQINGKGSWELNPWVWVIEFRKL